MIYEIPRLFFYENMLDGQEKEINVGLHLFISFFIYFDYDKAHVLSLNLIHSRRFPRTIQYTVKETISCRVAGLHTYSI